MSQAKQIMISGYYGFDNYGDELILARICEHLCKWGYQPVVLTQNAERTGQTLSGLNTSEIQTVPRMNIVAVWQAMQKISAFISGGGGLFQDKSSWKSPLYYSALISMAHHLAKPIAFFAQGVGPLNTSIGKSCASNALQKSKLIVVRDEKSVSLVNALQALWLKQKATPVFKMADTVWTTPLEFIYPDSDRRGISISIRPCELINNTSGWDNLLKVLLPLLQELPPDEPIYLIAAQPSEDVPVLNQLKQKLSESLAGRCQIITGLEAINNSIATSRHVIAMRYHVVLMSLLMQTPVYALAYDPKVQSLTEQAKIKGWNLMTNALQPPAVSQDDFLTIDPYCLKTNQDEAEAGFKHLENWLAHI